jgi:hypothetical protein
MWRDSCARSRAAASSQIQTLACGDGRRGLRCLHHSHDIAVIEKSGAAYNDTVVYREAGRHFDLVAVTCPTVTDWSVTLVVSLASASLMT